jgi:hypothetical protein
VQRHGRRRAAQIGNPGAASQVIEVSVSQPDIPDPPAAFLSFGDDQLSLVGGVNHSSLARRLFRD